MMLGNVNSFFTEYAYVGLNIHSCHKEKYFQVYLCYSLVSIALMESNQNMHTNVFIKRMVSQISFNKIKVVM